MFVNLLCFELAPVAWSVAEAVQWGRLDGIKLSVFAGINPGQKNCVLYIRSNIECHPTSLPLYLGAEKAGKLQA